MSKHKKIQHTKQDQQSEGRIHNSNKAAEQRGEESDISRVDQQEGTLEHGELGGNFRDADSQINKRGNG